MLARTVLLAMLAGTPGTLAQVVPAPAAAPEAPKTSAVDLQAFAAREIVRTAVIDLRLRKSPEPRDFRLTSVLVGLAQTLTPDDEEMVRWRVSLADAGDDAVGLEDQLRRLLELCPRDTNAQYRLISSRLRGIQVMEERLAKYERVVGPEGAGLDPSIRSRLAFECARLYRERGNDTGFVAKLKVATQLDPTNKEAAAEALEYFAGRTEDPMGRLELVANLLYSDPTDPETHLEMARELFSGGAFESAKRFQDNALAVYKRAGVDRGTPGLLEELAIDWPVEGPGKVVEKLNMALAVRRADVERIIRQLKADLQSTANVPQPEDIRLDPSLDRVRLLAARTAGDTQTADSATADLRKRYDEAFVHLKSTDETQASGITDPAAAVRSLRLELATLLAWADQVPEMVAKDIELVAAEPGMDPKDTDLLEARGWSMARTDKATEAVELLAPLADDRPISRLGLGAAYEKLGKKSEAVTEYTRVLREQPMTAEGCSALGRLAALTGVQAGDVALAKKMKATADSIPTLIDDITKDPNKMMALSAELAAPTITPTEHAVLRVTLTNLTTLPLGIGARRTIDSRILVSPALEVTLETMRDGVTPEILDLERRLRLMPRESMVVSFWPDPGLTGWLTETNCDQTIRIRWRLLQGFGRGPQGNIDAGPTCLTASTRPLVRARQPETSLTPAELGAKLADAADADLPGLVLAARSRLLAQAPGPAQDAKKADSVSDLSPPAAQDRPLLSDQDRTLIAEGAAKRFRNSGALARQILLSGLPHARQVPAMKVLDDLARSETDPATLCLVLVTRVTTATDELLVRAKESSDPRVAETARLMGERLTAGTSCFGSLGPGLVGLIGRTGEERP